MDSSILATITHSIVDTVNPEEVVLFGSHARGTAQAQSDLDLLVIMPDTPENSYNRRKLAGDIYRSLKSVPFPLDILVYTRSEVDTWRGVPGHVIAAGMEEGKRLYAQQ